MEPTINRSNAADYPPPSLNSYRTAASRADPRCPPAVWFRQMTGTDWTGDSKKYEHEKKRHRRMANEEYKAKEKERLAKRDAARLPQRQAQLLNVRRLPRSAARRTP